MHKKNIMRIEKDFLGSLEIPDDAYYGIHSLRAKNNFNNTSPFHIEWYQAMGLIKLACYNTYERFAKSVKNNNLEHKIRLIDIQIIKTLQKQLTKYLRENTLNILLFQQSKVEQELAST